jgi:hypothetical protein
MTKVVQSIVSDAAAYSVAGAATGYQDIGGVSTTEKSLDLTDLAGRYVKVYCETVDVYVTFTDVASNIILTTTSTVHADRVPDRIDQGGQGAHMVVPRHAVILKYKAVSGSGGNLRVIPT